MCYSVEVNKIKTNMENVQCEHPEEKWRETTSLSM